MTFDPPAAGRPGNGLIAVALAVAVLMIGGAVFLISHRGGGAPDYRDPVTLASAVRDAKGGDAASCGQLAAGQYLCAVATRGGSEGMYRVTVSDDGRSWSAEG